MKRFRFDGAESVRGWSENLYFSRPSRERGDLPASYTCSGKNQDQGDQQFYPSIIYILLIDEQLTLGGRRQHRFSTFLNNTSRQQMLKD